MLYLFSAVWLFKNEFDTKCRDKQVITKYSVLIKLNSVFFQRTSDWSLRNHPFTHLFLLKLETLKQIPMRLFNYLGLQCNLFEMIIVPGT